MTGTPTPSQPMAPTQPAPAGQPAGKPENDDRWNKAVRDIMGGPVIISILAVVLALVVGAILIAATDPEVQKAAGYFFARPGDTFKAIWDSVSSAYVSMFQGAIYNFRRPTFAAGIRPLTETLTFATPLIVSGLGVALAFRVGLFNIGGQGQILIAAAASAWVGFSWNLPPVIHLVLAVVAGIAGGAIWAGIVGVLKARTGAHEVIVTIMLNYIAFYLVAYMLRTQGLLQAPGSNNPKAPAIHANAVFPPLFGEQYNLTWAFIVVIAATVFVWWLINRSSLGFRFRAVGENPNAARVAGINVKNIYLYAMLIAGGLVGIAGASQALGVFPQGISSGVDAGIGFDAITVALLGRSKPWGVFIAGLLFGALKAGGFTIQAANDIPIDIVLVMQSLIVLFVAAPPLVRAIFRLPTPGSTPRRQRPIVTKEVAAK
ncbi:ABC transporter permease [Leifsonia aquatica]|uniref:Branched-chain amino acid ABC transporter, permease protein n=2 Tax=Leifsonia aquatica TaxID=144185 RepID=U2TFE7_LEIAQ|nr:ABC transporter permease [Leifsonia aquatica]ERK73422.1 branched-chain amino acid ABC transporter, permease protein [Leifsonia aquatica ATCC 14665]MBB2965410.1 simple sugar transport system permease protein [Leifsonia aquatica]